MDKISKHRIVLVCIDEYRTTRENNNKNNARGPRTGLIYVMMVRKRSTIYISNSVQQNNKHYQIYRSWRSRRVPEIPTTS